MILLTVSNLLALVDLNNATAEELLELNGIGKANSQKIIKYRETNQCFSSIDELSSIDGISKTIVSNNRTNLILGVCAKTTEKKVFMIDRFKDVLLDPINMTFVIAIFILGFLDFKTGKDLKSQIISVGVLGTFVGIFIGLQGFNPQDIVNSVNDILVGLKTAFFTSIVGMGVAIILSVIKILKGDSETE
jgi:competence ComEA-like helix-hairpin-helix protein